MIVCYLLSSPGGGLYPIISLDCASCLALLALLLLWKSLGWKYFAEKPNLKPKYFYGLSGKNIRVESDLNLEAMVANAVQNNS